MTDATSDDRNPVDVAVDVALDALLYAPVGLAMSARALVPKLAAEGRARLDAPLAAAKALGQVAVEQLLSGELLSGSRLSGPRPTARPAGSAATDAAATDAAATPRRATSGAAADHLAIPGYDSLSASQVLPRLEGLAAGELEAVRTYEADHRGRKTILGRIAQLQALDPQSGS